MDAATHLSASPRMSRYWRRSILIPLWLVQLAFQLLGTLIWYGLALILLDSFCIGRERCGVSDPTFRMTIATFQPLYGVVFLVTIAEIVVFVRQSLTSTFYLWSNVIKTTLSLLTWIGTVLVPYIVHIAHGSQYRTIKQDIISISFIIAVIAVINVPMVAALIHAVLFKKEQDEIWNERVNNHGHSQSHERDALLHADRLHHENQGL
jgi:hypothetical protein